MPWTPLRHVLANLLDNAIVHGRPDRPVTLAGWRDDDRAVVTISNETARLDESGLGELFEPFGRADTSTTREREGAGMGLYVVRRLVEHYGGTVSAHLDGGSLTVRLVLPVERRGTATPEVPTASAATA
jgi:signal transduction histidine kinase